MGPRAVRQLPREAEDSDVGTVLSSSSFSRTCVQCTSAWMARGSAAGGVCCSLGPPITLQVPKVTSRDRSWSHWPCRSSLSQGQYSPSKAGARHPHVARRDPWEGRKEGVERTERSVIFSQEMDTTQFHSEGLGVCWP